MTIFIMKSTKTNLVLFITQRGRPPLSSVLGGVAAESPAAIAHIGFPVHLGNLLELSVSSAFAFSSCK